MDRGRVWRALLAGSDASARRTTRRVEELEKQIRELQDAGRRDEEVRGSVRRAGRARAADRRPGEGDRVAEARRGRGGRGREGRYGHGPVGLEGVRHQEGRLGRRLRRGALLEPSSTLEDGTPSGADASIDLLRLVLYFGAKFTDRILFNSEIEYEHVTTGEGDEERGEVTVEFAYLDFLVRPRSTCARVCCSCRSASSTSGTSRRPTSERAGPSSSSEILPTTWSEIGAGVFGDIGSSVTYRAYVTSGLAAAAGTSSGAEGFTAEGIRDGRSKGGQASAEKLALHRAHRRRARRRPDGRRVVLHGRRGAEHRLRRRHALGAHDGVGRPRASTGWRGPAARAPSTRRRRSTTSRTSTSPRGSGSRLGGLGAARLVRPRRGTTCSPSWKDCRHELSPYVEYEQLNTQDEVPPGFAANPANDIDELDPRRDVEADQQRRGEARLDPPGDRARTGLDEINLSLGFMF